MAGDLRSRLERYHGDNVDGAFWLWNDAWLTPGFEPLDAASRLPRVRVPVLALQGEHDEYGTLTQLQAISRGVSGRCETRLMKECGHGPHLQDEPTLVEVIARFVRVAVARPVEPDAPRAPAHWPSPACSAARPAAAAQTGSVRDRQRRRPRSPAPSSDLAAPDDARRGEPLTSGDRPGANCDEIGVAALAVDGWVEARRLTLGGRRARRRSANAMTC